mgnify:FL=1
MQASTCSETAPVSVIKLIDQFIEDQRIACQWENSTVKMMRVFQHHVAAFGKASNLSYFDADGIDNFVHYLRSTAMLQEVTVRKNYKNLIWFLNWAERKGLYNYNLQLRNKQKFKIVQKPVIFLKREELMKVYHFQIPPTGTLVGLTDMSGKSYIKRVQDAPALERARDLFCFCAFTSLRYSDMAKLCRTDIDHDYIYVTTQKTHDRLPIDLNSYARAILDKYACKKFKGNRALPAMTNQRLNVCLKQLCELCGMNDPVRIVKYCNGERMEEVFPKWKKISSHCARKTFICYALSIGIPPVLVMKWTGHSDYKSMKPYIDIASEEKTTAMRLFDKSLESDLARTGSV